MWQNKFLGMRFRVGHGTCEDMMFRWGIEIYPECDCSGPNQIMNHILSQILHPTQRRQT